MQKVIKNKKKGVTLSVQLHIEASYGTKKT